MSRNQLNVEENLYKGQYLMSTNGMWKAVLQEDGNFVILNLQPQTVWESATAGTDIVRLSMQLDSNLAMYNAENTCKWHTDTNYKEQFSGSRRPTTYRRDVGLRLTDEGRLVLFRGSEEVWTSGNPQGTK